MLARDRVVLLTARACILRLRAGIRGEVRPKRNVEVEEVEELEAEQRRQQMVHAIAAGPRILSLPRAIGGDGNSMGVIPQQKVVDRRRGRYEAKGE